jgi:hypothetical protein
MAALANRWGLDIKFVRVDVVDPSCLSDGLPLEVVLQYFRERGMVLDWADYVAYCLKDGPLNGPRPYCAPIPTRLRTDGARRDHRNHLADLGSTVLTLPPNRFERRPMTGSANSSLLADKSQERIGTGTRSLNTSMRRPR